MHYYSKECRFLVGKNARIAHVRHDEAVREGFLGMRCTSFHTFVYKIETMGNSDL